MAIEFGAEVVDKNGKFLGTVEYLIRNSWTGEISKFMVSGEALETDLFFTPEDIVKATGQKIHLAISLDEWGEKPPA
jgi:sporulation protein YlmC with PRC-barrel domain